MPYRCCRRRHCRRRQLHRCRRHLLPAPARVQRRRHLQHVLLTDRKARKQGRKEAKKQEKKLTYRCPPVQARLD